jgi:predicted DNA-binding transcriptional regulator YafY
MFDALWRTRQPRALDELCEELKISPATAKRLIAFLRTQRGVEVRYDRDRNGYFLARGPQDANVAALLGLSGAEISMLLEAEALLEQFPPGFLRRRLQSVIDSAK